MNTCDIGTLLDTDWSKVHHNEKKAVNNNANASSHVNIVAKKVKTANRSLKK